MRPLIRRRALAPTLIAVAALVLSAPAGAGNALAKAPQTIGGSTAMKADGPSAATPTRPDDRAVHRPTSRAPVLAEEPAGDTVEWPEFGLGLLGGLGVSLVLVGGLLVVVHRRDGDRVAL
jgi:hypothetical protein